jgi:4-hydroxybenzoate polyprenyltransferase
LRFPWRRRHYILNDLIDLDATDGIHEKLRPLAAVRRPFSGGDRIAPSDARCARLASAVFVIVLGRSCELCSAHHSLLLALKRKLIVDVIVLAALYTIRVIGRAAAISVLASEWCLVFRCLFS